MSKNPKRGNEKSQPVWDVLAGLSAGVGNILALPSVLVPYLQDSELLGKIEDRSRFNRLGTCLERDIRSFTVEFRDLQLQHQGRSGHSKDPTEVMRTIDIHQQYVDWAFRFDDVVIPTFMDMLQMIKNAGGSTESIAIPSAARLAQQLN